ncbi:carbamoyl-phosphate synthase large subunit [Archaeoglobus fulgidus]|uniref:Carbamoyl phosphate synthase large chain n=3 Tax=Archaeoglobus fulgidus TaxID=2234 RepID=CARB_ARCFU|nr:carbamoyl-phosphate synthase large subunit [Archaeoglobus fulgidus]O28994.1 RecName: Full=Carbamoyl phosphate synthase large chain; AltName: Full=Carbamoyl phosphate synthetase ammonia chain [Archaeoglobus fulgidus DSM 4304]AAB89970.1 carbamoyl-phosphate synthase, large (or ammonia) subunit (carB) [Archaeoglobus fulgidus DSM 4304]AIG98153.1 carbamoyl-phosphate synthase, large subunit [Archaeoglobus fulgidus DSM 8774]KUJ92923.1 MAG: Carbamoyl-phosphate synthase large chain [Archaeoglobus fulg
MPKREDIRKIMVIGSGPIVIGQAAEFDYSGSQACKALREEGYEVVLVNSNPATIMTDPEMADRVYIEPLDAEIVAKIIERETPDALLPTLGGQTALNLAVQLTEMGVLDKYGVELIGAKFEAIKKAEDRELFKEAMRKIGLDVPKSDVAHDVSEALAIADEIGYPVVVRPAFTLGGTGGGIAYNREELREIAERGIKMSMINQVLIEEGVLGWKEFELEVMRDLADNVVIICSIENFDPMGVHTGDSITVAPAQTLTDVEYQYLRDAAIKIIREIGVETGGSNIQFAVHPENGRVVAIEMNPRVSRSSALASKATGFPIAKIAAKLAVGYTLDEIPNDITKETPASFEPTIDYVVVKIPRFAFDKFPTANQVLGSQMKSVGEVMAVGRTFEEALQKAIRSLEIGRYGLGCDGKDKEVTMEEIRERLRYPNASRVFYIRYALQKGMSVNEIYELTKIDPWFIDKIKNLVEFEEQLKQIAERMSIEEVPKEILKKAKELGYSDRQLAVIFNTTEREVRRVRKGKGLRVVYKMVDTCAAEFEAKTPYYYSTYEDENEALRSERKKVMILGAGPNRIGQGIEFDYCCVHAVFSLKDEGYETIMVNCNPETVSTDYDTSDRLYFEPITHEDVMNIYENEQPEGVIVQFGGQTPLNIARELEDSGARILGTSVDSIDIAEDRERFAELLERLNIPQPENGIAHSLEEAKEIARKIGFPVLVRPSYVLGGRAMEIVYDEETLERYITEALEVSPEKPILIDKFLEDAIEVEVDALCDGEEVVIGGIMEHIEEAGVHSGDSACVLPPVSLDEVTINTIVDYTRKLALALNVVGLINIQYAVKDGKVYVLEANPRASRTVPFVSKATGIPLAKIAAKLMMGKKLRELGVKEKLKLKHVAVKEAVFPFIKLPGVDPVLGPEMKSTGEVMGIDYDFGLAYYKAELAAGMKLPLKGTVFISVRRKDKNDRLLYLARKFKELGFRIIATDGTRDFLVQNGIEADLILKISQGRPNILDAIVNGQVDLIINTPSGKRGRTEGYMIRRAAVDYGVAHITTLAGAMAAVRAIEAVKSRKMVVKSIQEYHEES